MRLTTRFLLHLAKAWLALSAMVLLTGGCREPTQGFQPLRPDAIYPYVSYSAGTCDDSTFVTVDLDTAAVRVQVGPTHELTTRESTLSPSEVEAGRRLFTDSRVAHYDSLSSSGSTQGTAGAAGAPATEQDRLPADEEEGDAGDPDVPTNTPPIGSCNRTGDWIGLTVTIPPGSMNKVFLKYPVSGVEDEQVTEMLDYFTALAVRYAPESE